MTVRDFRLALREWSPALPMSPPEPVRGSAQVRASSYVVFVAAVAQAGIGAAQNMPTRWGDWRDRH